MAELFDTSDTALASYLITEGYQLLSIDYTQPRFRYFFQDSDGIKQASNLYISGNALTDPANYIRVNKKLLNTIAHREQWGAD